MLKNVTEPLKKCRLCKQSKYHEEFQLRVGGKRSAFCKVCSGIEPLEPKLVPIRDPLVKHLPMPGLDRYSAYRVGQNRRKYLEKYGYQCNICGKKSEVGAFGNFADLHIDHDHYTNLVRGVLCGACNSGLGFMKDNPEKLETAIQYLRHHALHKTPFKNHEVRVKEGQLNQEDSSTASEFTEGL